MESLAPYDSKTMLNCSFHPSQKCDLEKIQSKISWLTGNNRHGKDPCLSISPKEDGLARNNSFFSCAHNFFLHPWSNPLCVFMCQLLSHLRLLHCLDGMSQIKPIRSSNLPCCCCCCCRFNKAQLPHHKWVQIGCLLNKDVMKIVR